MTSPSADARVLRSCGIVEFEHAGEALAAISGLSNSLLQVSSSASVSSAHTLLLHVINCSLMRGSAPAHVRHTRLAHPLVRELWHCATDVR